MVQDNACLLAKYDEASFPMSGGVRSIYKHSQYAATYMHNGNKKSYTKYKQKALDAYSEVLDSLMDAAASPGGLLLGADYHDVEQESYTNEGAVIKFGKDMKDFGEMMSAMEKPADALGLWK